MIEIQGLTSKQQALCEIIWSIDDRDMVMKFIDSLPLADQKLCLVLCQLMRWAFLDEVESVDEAEALLARFRL